MGKRLTHDEVVQRIKIINPNIEILGRYVNTSTKIKCKCLIDKYEWMARPHTLQQGKGCPMCAGNAKKTTQQFINEIQQINPNIKILGKYINAYTKIDCECLKCKNVWSVTPHDLLKGVGCPNCKSIKLRDIHTKTHQQFMQEMQSINQNIIILDTYTGIKNKIKCKCAKCNNEWRVTPSDLLQKVGCPSCVLSKLENKVKEYLDSHNICYKSQYRFDNCRHIRPLPFDFAIFKNNILMFLIETDGIQHYMPTRFHGETVEQSNRVFEHQKFKDNIKTQYCKENNIKLLRIPYWEFDNIENILDDKLLKGGG